MLTGQQHVQAQQADDFQRGALQVHHFDRVAGQHQLPAQAEEQLHAGAVQFFQLGEVQAPGLDPRIGRQQGQQLAVGCLLYTSRCV